MNNPMTFRGVVEKGIGLGKKLGFPTFNLHVDPLPDLVHGVYAVRARVEGEGSHGTGEVWHDALMHFGPKPTVSMESVFCEVYFLQFPEGLEIHELEVQVLGKLRDVMRFESLDALVEQMKEDERRAVESYFKV